jgi:hypothetical protein
MGKGKIGMRVMVVEKVIKLMEVIKEIQVNRLTSGEGENCDE